MWLSIKEAAGRAKPKSAVGPAMDKMVRDELGLQGAIHYNRLLDRFPPDEAPEAQRGPDETISDHYSRLKRTLDEERAAYERDRGAPKIAPVRERALEDEPTPEWLQLKQKAEEAAPPRKPGQREPGWHTSPGSESYGYGVPPEPVAGPLTNTGIPPGGPQSPQQTMQQWLADMRGRGITLNHSLQRPDAANVYQAPRPMGRDIWAPFIGPSTDSSYATRTREADEGGLGKSLKQRVKDKFRSRKASSVVTDYIEGILVDMP